MSATISSTNQHDQEELAGALRTLFHLLDRQRLVERELAALYRGLDEVAEALYNRATRTASDAR
jgi:hypothetical protein